MPEGAIDDNFFFFLVHSIPTLRGLLFSYSQAFSWRNFMIFFFQGCCQEVASSPYGALALPISSTSCVSG